MIKKAAVKESFKEPKEKHVSISTNIDAALLRAEENHIALHKIRGMLNDVHDVETDPKESCCLKTKTEKLLDILVLNSSLIEEISDLL